MLDQLTDNQIRILRKFFEDRGIPETEENFQKWGTGDVLDKVMRAYGEETGLGEDQASQVLREIRQVADATNKFKPKSKSNSIVDPFTLTDREILKRDLEDDELDAEQVEKLPLGYTQKAEDEVGDYISKAADKVEKAEPGFLYTEEDFKNVDDMPVAEPEPNKDAGKTPVDEEILKQEVPEDAPKDSVPSAEQIAKMSPEERKKRFGEDKEEVDFGGVEIEGEVPKLPNPPGLGKSTPPSNLDTVSEAGAKLNPSIAKRPPEDTDYALGSVPANQRRTYEKVPDTAETWNSIMGEASKNEFASALNPILGIAQQQLAKDAKLPDGHPDKMNDADRAAILAGMSFLNPLTKSEQSNLDTATRSAEESFKVGSIGKKQEETFDKLTKILESLAQEASGRSPDGQPSERDENLQDMAFRTRARRIPVKKEYQEALSSIDRKKMTDYIAKGLGQIASGAIGQYGFSRAIPVAEHFKYDKRDYTPELQEAAKNYRTQMSGINNELLSIQKMMGQGKGSPEDVTKRLTAVAGAIKAIVDQAKLTRMEHQQKVGTEEVYLGIMRQMMPLINLVSKLYNDELNRRSREKIGPNKTEINVTDKRSEGQAVERETETKLSAEDVRRIDAAMNSLRKQSTGILQIANPQKKMQALMDIIGGLSIVESDVISVLGEPSEWGTNPVEFSKKVRDMVYSIRRGTTGKQKGKKSEEVESSRTSKGSSKYMPKEAPGIRNLPEPDTTKPRVVDAPFTRATPPMDTRDQKATAPETNTQSRTKFPVTKYKGETVSPRIRNGKLVILYQGKPVFFDLDSPEAKQLMGQ